MVGILKVFNKGGHETTTGTRTRLRSYSEYAYVGFEFPFLCRLCLTMGTAYMKWELRTMIQNPNYTIIAYISNEFTDRNHISYLDTPRKMCDTHI